MKKSNVSIVSDGTSQGSQVVVGGQVMTGVCSVEIEKIEPDSIQTSVTIKVVGVTLGGFAGDTGVVGMDSSFNLIRTKPPCRP